MSASTTINKRLACGWLLIVMRHMANRKAKPPNLISKNAEFDK